MRTLFLAALLLLPMAHAESFQLVVPEQVNFIDGFVMSGQVDGLPGLRDPILVNPSGVDLGQGILTVCPRDQATDIVEALNAARPGCDDEQTFTNPSIEFGLGSIIQLQGAYDESNTATAVHAMFDASGNWLILTSEPMELVNIEGFAFAPIIGRSTVTVSGEEGTETFRRAEWTFHHESHAGHWEVDGYASKGTANQIQLSPADRTTFQQLPDPFLFLDLQESLVGPDARDRRSDAAAVLNQFGRIPDVVNGAIYGNLTGNYSRLDLTGGGMTALRFESATLLLGDGTMDGEGELQLLVSDEGISTGGIRWKPMWWVGAVFWLLAVAVMAVRRFPPDTSKAQRWASIGFMALAALVMDLAVFWRRTGTGFLPSLFRGDSLPVIATMAGILLVTFLICWIVYVFPLRIIGRRLKIMDNQWFPWALDGGIVFLFLFMLSLWPAMYVASAYDFLRF